MTDQAVTELIPQLGVRAACEAVGAAQAGYYRRHRQRLAPTRPEPVPHRQRHQPRALTAAEQQAVLDALHSDRFADLAPAEVCATLLDEGVYLGSESTFYRLLRRAGEVRERRRQATHPAKVKPELVANAPKRGVVLGYNEIARPSEVDLLLPVRDLGHLLSLRRWLDGCQPRIGRAGRGADPPDLHQARHRACPVDDPRRPRQFHDLKPVAFLLADLGVTQSHRDHTSPTTTRSARPSSRR